MILLGGDDAAMPNIPPEALEGVGTGRISLADIIREIKYNFVTDYELLFREDYLNRIRQDGIRVLVQSLNEGNLVLMTSCILLTICLMLFFHETLFDYDKNESKDEDDEEEEETPPRDFTVEQLRDFDGEKNEKIYIAMRGEVYDVSHAKDYYGVDATYHCFAGRDASRAMAKLSFDEEELSNQCLDDLGLFERDTLQGWIDKFKYYKQYPIVGQLSFPNVGVEKRVFTVSELAKFKGIAPPAEKQGTDDNQNKEVYQELLPGRVSREILLCLKGKVYDVSYGGVEMYGEGGPYHRFAGIDASRALAKMSFKDEDVNSRDLSDLTEEQLQVLDDWEKKFLETKKYPVVGVMDDADDTASSDIYVIPEKLKKSKADEAER